jgi:PRTRC genetic system protein B
VYGTSDYNGFPYRHPFLTVHEVVHEGENARLAAGQLVTPDMLVELMASLGRSVPVEILPERVLVRTADTLLWWVPASVRVMFFSDRGGDPTLVALNGKKYPHPPLVFKASGSRLWVRALKDNRRPDGSSSMHIAPYWNCDERGGVCTGTMRIPREKSVAATWTWEQSFFQSEFTHALGAQKRTRHPKGVLALWKSVQGKNTFPARYLLPVNETLADFVNPNEHTTNRQ